MNRRGPSPEIRTKTKRETARLPLKDRPAIKLLRFLFTIILAVVLAVVFIKMIMPNKEGGTPRPDIVMTVAPHKTAEGEFEAPPGDDGSTHDATGEVVRVYRGQGGEPIDDPTLTWEITLEISNGSLRLLEGNIVVREFAGDPPTSDFSFSITPNRYLINLTESATVMVGLDDTYDPLAASLFSINDKNQFFVYVTPKKLSMPPGTVPSRFLTERENSELITMQGFIRTDNKVVGTFHSRFGPNIEYVLESFTTE
ncbi:MAG: hypothetical protein JW765_02795 [Deltaproteobacteria bacterium]|nr:hypothetical protein [Candidatus Zymogenaceae bacterium]